MDITKIIDFVLLIIKIILFFSIFFSLWSLNTMDNDKDYEQLHKKIQPLSLVITICAIALWVL